MAKNSTNSPVLGVGEFSRLDALDPDVIDGVESSLLPP